MPRKKITFDTAREIAAALPGVEESTAYGTPALKVRGNWFVCVPTNRSAEPDSLAFRVDFDRRADLLATAPDIYYAPEHYVNYPCVLVRLSRINTDVLRGLVRMAYDFVTAKKKSRPKRRK